MRLKEWQKIVLIVVICFIIAYLFYSLLFRSFSDQPRPLSKTAFLELVIAGEIPERLAIDPLLEALEETPMLSMQDLLFSIRKAKVDDQIKGIILRPFSSTMGWGKVTEIRNALRDFKTSGKPVYAFMDAVGDKEYYLATVADTILGYGTGILFANGFSSEPVFLKETFAKLGIEADFVAIGKYKNAPDTYTRKSMSDPQREVLNSILDQFYNSYIDTLAAARQLAPETVRGYIDRGLYSLEAARLNGLVDTLIYYNDFKELLKTRYGKQLNFVSLSRYREVPYPGTGRSSGQTIAVVYGVGTIVIGGEGLYERGELITSEGMANNIRKAAQNEKIKAIILRINSPGGSGSASDVIWREVVEARKKKPVIVSVSDVAASGGYYLSMGADSIVAHPHSLVGSIGIFAGKFAWSDLYDKIGLHKEKITRGRNADVFSETQLFTPEQRTIIREFIGEFYRDFINKVAEGRGMSPEAVAEIAQGRVWTGKQAREIGLVDKLGDFHTAVQLAKRMAGIPEDELVQLAIYPKLKTYFERLLGGNLKVQLLDQLPGFGKLSPALRSTLLALPHFQPGEPLYLCMYYF